MSKRDTHSRVELLSGQFFRRFFDNDLVSPNGDGHEQLATILAVVAVPGLFVSVFLLLSGYTSPLLSPGERLLTALPHKFLLFACATCVMALVTCVGWDALTLDARDHAILGPLPLNTRTIVTAKLGALGAFAGLFAFATNAIPALAFPLVFLGTVPIGLWRGLWVIGVHASVSVLASLFGFVAILALRETVRVLAGRRAFRFVSAPLQLAAVLTLGSTLLLLPAIPSASPMNWLANRDGIARWLPPMWFVGLEEVLTADIILEAPGNEAPSAGRFWTVGRDRRARAAYRVHTPAFEDLARIATAAPMASTVVALTMLLAGMRRTLEGPVTQARHSVPVSTLLARALARHPQRQAGLAFTLQTLGRSPEHRLYFAGYLAAGAATALVLAGPSLRLAEPGPSPRLYAVQMILVFFVVAGLRGVFARPAAVASNWVFQLCWTGDERRYRSGVRRAVAVTLAAFLILLAPLHAVWLDAPKLATHFIVGWIVSLTVAEIAVLDRTHIPFTCAMVPTGALKKWWPAYLVAFWSLTFGIAALERRAFETATGTAWLVASFAVCYGLTRGVGRWRARQPRPVVFEEPPDLTQELGLAKT